MGDWRKIWRGGWLLTVTDIIYTLERKDKSLRQKDLSMDSTENGHDLTVESLTTDDQCER